MAIFPFYTEEAVGSRGEWLRPARSGEQQGVVVGAQAAPFEPRDSGVPEAFQDLSVMGASHFLSLSASASLLAVERACLIYTLFRR